MARSIIRHRGALWALALIVALPVTSGWLTLVFAQPGEGRRDAAPLPPLVPDPVVLPASATPLPVPSTSSVPPAALPKAVTPSLVPDASPVPPAVPPTAATPSPVSVGAVPERSRPADPGPSTSVPRAAAAIGLRATARAEGTAAPGLRVTLHGEDTKGADLRFRWVQTRGPAVQMDDPTAPLTRFTVPTGIGPLGFLLVAAGPDGSDTAELTIPIEGLPRTSENTALRADAGDDQLALVGRQVTLNGVRSEPRGRIGYRWVQTGGPVVRCKIEDGYIFAFVPTAPGVYRFALVVASGSEISPADEVAVTVGSGSRAGAPAGPTATASLPVEGPVATQEVARASLAAVRGGQDAAEPLARIFDDTADRMDLYHVYGDAFSELSRRLEEILPGDATKRAVWVERLFNPLSTRTLEVMRAEGLDLRLPEGQTTPLSASQKGALAEQFRLMAEGFRSVSRPR